MQSNSYSSLSNGTCALCEFGPIFTLKDGVCEFCLIDNEEPMKVQKKISVQGEYAKPNEDIKNGDTITILDGGTEITGKFGDQIVYSVDTRNGAKNLGINQTSINALIDEWGDETTNWIGKKVGVILVKQMIQGGLRDVIYLCPDGWTMNSQGKIVKGATISNEPSVQLDDDLINEDPF